ncbi:MAG: ACT domain-containing protein [Mogibacterium sp.]|nr:ACT domain-containing protein [Mogibacterium sp.]
MKKQENAVLTVVGKNHIGILAGVATAVAEANGNVIEVSQKVMDDFFTMNMLIDVTDLSCTIHQLEENIKASLPETEVHLMHDNIFSAMHSI